MEDATSIFQLRETNGYASERKAPLDVVSYSDVLKNLQSEEIQHHQRPVTPPPPPPPPPPPASQTLPPPPQTPFAAFRGVSPETPSPPVVTTTTEEKSLAMDNTFQNEMIILLMVYVFVHMSHVQSWLRNKVPNIVDQTGSTSVLGLLMNGIAVIVIWNVSKRMVVRYMNDL